jgi:hypothetical protein
VPSSIFRDRSIKFAPSKQVGQVEEFETADPTPTGKMTIIARRRP